MEKINFEQSIKELENIVQELENGNLNLEDSIKQFEKGMELSKKLNEILENAEKKISILIKTENGLTQENFENE